MTHPPPYGEPGGEPVDPSGWERRFPSPYAAPNFEWPVPREGSAAPKGGVASTARTAAAALVAVALVLSGMAAGVALGKHPNPAAPQTQSRLSASRATLERDTGIVDVDTVLQYQEARAAGTGMLLTSNGDILTNNHVIEGATSIEVTDVDTGQTFRASVLGMDVSADVAVLHIVGASGLRTVNLGTSSTLGVGSAVTALGNAGGVGGLPAVSHGVVIGEHLQITAGNSAGELPEHLTDMVETSATLVPGDSGGPLIDAHGTVVGMDTAAGGNSSDSGANFAIPIDRAIEIAQRIESGSGTSTVHIGPTPFLGVEIDPSSHGGAKVVGVLPGTPAWATPLSPGDYITSVGGIGVPSGASLTGALLTLRVGEGIEVAWKTPGGVVDSTHVVLMAGPAA